MGLFLAWACLIAAALPAFMIAWNLRYFHRAPAWKGTDAGGVLPHVALLIPARNEEATIDACLTAATASVGVNLEIHVLDDASTDGTAAIVQRWAARDRHVHLVPGTPLPPGWCGKQHACWQLASRTQAPLLAWIDADVQLASTSMVRMAGLMQTRTMSLLSGFPQQVTGSWMERRIVPLIPFVLLGFLPLAWMRQSRRPAYGAGCGQLFMARRADYFIAGGHAAIRSSLHDGLQLPRAFRRAGLVTDLVDASDLASCRMYHGASQVWRGFAKNATEGMASPAAIVPWTLALLFGQVLPLPWLLTLLLTRGTGLATGAFFGSSWELMTMLGLALLCNAVAWIMQVRWLGSDTLAGIVWRPVAVLLLLGIQWEGLVRSFLGKPATWRGRSYPPNPRDEAPPTLPTVPASAPPHQAPEGLIL